mgnify:CR=1 FL=1
MPKKAKSYRVDTKKKTIILYTNIKQTVEDKFLISTYLDNGYKMKAEKKITVEDMRKELSKDKPALDEFNRLYKLNEEGAALGFHRAMQHYTKWKKGK